MWKLPNQIYVGQTERSFNERIKTHMKFTIRKESNFTQYIVNNKHSEEDLEYKVLDLLKLQTRSTGGFRNY